MLQSVLTGCYNYWSNALFFWNDRTEYFPVTIVGDIYDVLLYYVLEIINNFGIWDIIVWDDVVSGN